MNNLLKRLDRRLNASNEKLVKLRELDR